MHYIPRLLSLLGSSLALVAGVSHVRSANAAPIHYSESTDGDLSELPPYKVLDLGIGVNTGSGASHITVGGSSVTSDDFDQFAFTVPAQTTLASITFTSTVTFA